MPSTGRLPVQAPNPYVSIRITNPIAGGKKRCSQKRAEYFISNGMAQWASAGQKAITFRENEYREERAAKIVTQQLVAAWNYDKIGRVMRPEEIKNLPMTGSVWSLYTNRTRRSVPAK